MTFSLHDHQHRTLFGDNHSGAHPEVLDALVAASGGHVPAYGDDPYTAELRTLVRDTFGARAEVYPVWNGSGANVVALSAMCDRWGAVICADSAHANLDECGAPEKLAGLKMLAVPSVDGKLTADAVQTWASSRGNERRAQPQALTVTQCTELGTVYTADELGAITEAAHAADTIVHMDGARLANAAAALGVGLRDAVGDVDVLSLGGTKNGLLGAEAVVVLNPDSVRGVSWLRKLTCQLPSKMRYVSAQLLALYGTDLWHRCASNANAMATLLAETIAREDGVTITRPVQTNAVFATVPPELARGFPVWTPATGEVRMMCSFDTTEEDVARVFGR